MLGDRHLPRLPGSPLSHHGMHDGPQFVPTGSQGHFLEFARRQQTFVEGFVTGL